MQIREWNVEAILGVQFCCAVKWGGQMFVGKCMVGAYVQDPKRIDKLRSLIVPEVQYLIKHIISKMDYEISKDPNTAIWEYLPEYVNLTPVHLRQAVYNHCVQIMTPNDGFHDLEILNRVKKLLGASDDTSNTGPLRLDYIQHSNSAQ